MNRPEPMKLIVTIIERGHGARMRQFYLSEAYQLRCIWQSIGQGTASSELLNILGIGTPEKDVLFTLATGPSARSLFQNIHSGLQANTHAKGILFSIPLNAVNGLAAAALEHLETLEIETIGEKTMDSQTRHSLILVVLNQGYTDTVMATARAAGAKGGTVLRTRWAGDDEVHNIMGITVQTERELLAIVTPYKERAAIMEAINTAHGLKAKAQALVCSLPVEDIARLG